ncbi:Uncharacterized protein DAT39_007965, partial [Clarias magur]
SLKRAANEEYRRQIWAIQQQAEELAIKMATCHAAPAWECLQEQLQEVAALEERLTQLKNEEEGRTSTSLFLTQISSDLPVSLNESPVCPESPPPPEPQLGPPPGFDH